MVFIPKCRRKALYLELRRHLGEVFRKLALQKESNVEEGHLMPDHVHMLLSIPPKYAVSQVVGYIKGGARSTLARVYAERKRNFVGQHFWARGFFVNTVGRHEEAIRAYIRNQEKEDQRLEQLNLGVDPGFDRNLPEAGCAQMMLGVLALQKRRDRRGGSAAPDPIRARKTLVSRRNLMRWAARDAAENPPATDRQSRRR